MGKSISAFEQPLSKIFSSDFKFTIPSYQRPYAWTDEQTNTLFDDLYDFYKSNSEDNYFLGSIVLIKEDENAHAEVIDGQQRLTTLTILLSIITSKLDGDADFKAYLQEPGRASQGLKPSPRLTLRARDQEFFNQYIQNLKIEELLKLDVATLKTEAQQNIYQNAKKLNERFSAFETTEDVAAFGCFLVQRCYLVVVTTTNQESAYRVFSVMNSRGLPLLPIDIMKSEIIGDIDSTATENYTSIWEDLENNTGRDGFNDLFMHIRMIYAEVKAKKGLIDEFRENVLSKYPDRKKLIDDVLTPYAEAYSIMKNSAFVSSDEKCKEETNNNLRWLNKIENSDWVPSALRFYVLHKNEPEEIRKFISKLERLSSFLYIASYDVNKRIERYSKILNELDANPNASTDSITSIDLTNEEKTDFLNILQGDIYTMSSKKRNYTIMRLNWFVSDGEIINEPKTLTIEHVLPQTINPTSQWAEWWPEEETASLWRHKIGNLVPLARRQNSEAQNYDFAVKKEKYFQSKNGTTSFALTTQVINESTWTEDVLKRRQEQLINTFKNKWDLNLSSEIV